MGGAMDLVNGAKRVVVIMEHVNKHGETKIKKDCTLPLTGLQVVHRLITDLAVFDFTPEGMVLIETLGDVTVDEVKEKTEAEFTVAAELLAK
jgi:3-oxoacid CoA-transferase subunit B